MYIILGQKAAHPRKLIHSVLLDCKTVGFFLKISEEIGKAWRLEAYAREVREPHTPVGNTAAKRLRMRQV